MDYILDPCVLAYLRLPESNPWYNAISRILDHDSCYITPINLAEVYRRVELHDGNLAQALLDLFMSDSLVTVVSDRDAELIKCAVTAKRECGVSYPVAFCAGLARMKSMPVLAARVDMSPSRVVPEEHAVRPEIAEELLNEFEVVKQNGFCEVEWLLPR